MKKLNKTNMQWIARISIVAALYVALTLVSYPFSYGLTQFRISEVLMLLVCLDKRYSIAMVLGCLISNFFSFNLIDCIFGTLATAIACVLMIITRKHIVIASLFPALVNGVIIGLELHYILEFPLLFSMASVAFGELVVVTGIGLLIYSAIKSRKEIFNKIAGNEN